MAHALTPRPLPRLEQQPRVDGGIWRRVVVFELQRELCGVLVDAGALAASSHPSFGKVRANARYLRIQSELYTHSEVVSSPK